MRHPFLYAAIFGLLFFPALRFATTPERIPSPMLGQVPAFALTDAQGQTTTSEDLRGGVWIASLACTHCGGRCAAATSAMSELHTRLAGAQAPVQLVTLVVPPPADATNTGKPGGRPPPGHRDGWRVLTGPPDDVRALVVGSLGPAVGHAPGTTAHSHRLVVVDGEGQIRGVLGSGSIGVDDGFRLAMQLVAETKRP